MALCKHSQGSLVEFVTFLSQHWPDPLQSLQIGLEVRRQVTKHKRSATLIVACAKDEATDYSDPLDSNSARISAANPTHSFPRSIKY